MASYARDIGASAGRGGYDEAAAASQILKTCRRQIATLINATQPDSIIFTHNGTDALNLAVGGIVDPHSRNHLICTALDHNSVLRPMHRLLDDGLAELTILPADPRTGCVDPSDLHRAIRSDTRLVAVPHASNVCGAVQRVSELARIAREHDVPFLLDAAQTAGHWPIDVEADLIDLLAAPGHKGMLGPTGTGFLYIRPGLQRRVRPLRQGGTGSQSEDPRQPTDGPDRYEAGTHNVIGLAGLNAAISWVLENTVERLRDHEAALINAFATAIAGYQHISVLGADRVERVAVTSLTVTGVDPQELAAALEASFGILSRSGLHCAPLAHQAFGTLESGGATRFSFGPFNTTTDVTRVAGALVDTAAGALASQR